LTRYRPHPEVLVTELEGGGAVLFQVSSRATFTLNATGARIWTLLAQEDADIAGTLAAEFAVTGEQAERSVARLCDELLAAELLIAEHA
jgi:hypothetical protein